MLEFILLYYLLDRNIYNKYYKYTNITNTTLTKLYDCIKVLMDSYDETKFTPQDLEICLFTQYPFLKGSEKEQYKVIFERFSNVSVEGKDVEPLLRKQREMAQARKLAELALEVSEGRKDFSEVMDHVSDIDFEQPIEEEIDFVSDDLEELYKEQIATPGLRWRLNCLNRSLGSLRRGDFGFIFARPETGKTTFLASEVTFMATQTENPILWFNNEEQGQKVMLRCIQASLGLDQTQLYSDLTGNKQRFWERSKRNIKLIDNASIHKHDVERICKQMKPSLIIFDQMDKVKGFDGDRNDLALGACYQWARELAKTYAPVIAVSQADGQGEGVKWLHMGHVANAKTSKQAEADWILGLGKSNDDGMNYMRYLNISKNKLQGDADTLPAERHGQFQCIIRPEIGRYGDT